MVGFAIESDTAWSSPVQSSEKLITQDEYLEWAHSNIGTSFDEVTQRNYERNAGNALLAVREHVFLDSLKDFLRDCRQRYHQETGSDLFMGDVDPGLQPKSYAAAVNRPYRQNVIWNRECPDEPHEGWVTPNNWFTKLNDCSSKRHRCRCGCVGGREY